MSRRDLTHLLFAGMIVATGYSAPGAGPAQAGISGLVETVSSADGHYRVTIRPEQGDPGVGPIHAWILTVTDAQGNPVEGAAIIVNGGMPMHGHGLPTAPEMVGEISPGVYRIDGVKFSMIGKWELRFTIQAPAGKDMAVFAFTVE